MDKMKKIYLQWADATSPADSAWSTEEEAKRWAEEDSYWIEQMGWVIEENEKYILICTKKSTTKTREDIIQVGGIQKIPTTWIRKRKEIK